jgi:hypothetical protein
VLAIILCGLACASVEQHMIGWNEHSHFAQVRAFDRGTPIIDRYHTTTGDRAFYRGHFYSDKAPGMAFLLVPVYHLARITGVTSPGGTVGAQPGGIGMVHLLVLFGCVLPAVIIMLLGYRLVERGDPGQGAAAALTLGFGTLLLPFATILFSHVLSAALGFGAFYLLWRARERGGSLALTAAAGALAGYAVGIEYPMALLAGLLGLFVVWRRDPVKPALAYGAGLIVGLIPLLAYDWWAFGSPLHLSYSYVAANSSGVLGLGAPSLRSALALLISGRGLFVVTPVTAAAIAGIVVLYREGRRLEAIVPAVVAAAYFAYNACYYLPFGGWVPGPRFLITVLPFLAVPLGAAYRKAPVATLSLAVISAATMITATLTQPLLPVTSPTSIWWTRLGNGTFGTHGVTIILFAIFAVLAIAVGVRATPRPRLTRIDLELAALGVGTWFAMESGAQPLLAHVAVSEVTWGLVVLLVIGIALTASVTYVARGRQLALLAGIPLIVLSPWWFHHPTLMFALAAIALGSLLLFVRPHRVGSRSEDHGVGPSPSLR